MSQATSPRFPAIDHLKAAAILGVIVDHALPATFAPLGTASERALRWAVQFHVPVFLVVSGFLYAPAGLRDARIVVRRLTRLLVPYAVASAVMMLAGFSPVASAAQVVLRLVTGSALMIYYFVFLLTVSILLTAVLVRLGARAVEIALVLVWLYPVAALCWPALRIPTHVFWGPRNPLYYSGYFLAGWVARERWPALRRVAGRSPAAIASACVAAIAAYATFCWMGAPGPRAAGLVFRGLYTFATIGVVALVAGSWPAPAPVRFLSTATYGIYLYHLPFIIALRPHVEAWWPPYRTLVLFAAGLAGGSLVCTLGARLLGRRARLVLGA